MIPLLQHALTASSIFTPETLVSAVRAERGLPQQLLPTVCVLDFDGDLTDSLVSRGLATHNPAWACFHTEMYTADIDGTQCGLIPRTIGGPYAVLVAEQLSVSGTRIVIGLTSAGRVAPSLPVPALVVATSAVRDEGTSYHYLPSGPVVTASPGVAAHLHTELSSVGLPVESGCVWTTDAPYRETREQFEEHIRSGVLAVEMQAASLFAFAQARQMLVGVVAHVTNAVDVTSDNFDKGPADLSLRLFRAVCRAGLRIAAG